MRDRLIELLKGAETKVSEELSRPLALEEWLGIYADHLLTNGVTVQEWISVKDRLPEQFVNVLCYFPEKDYGSKAEIDYAETTDGNFASSFKWGHPTHWMPLPQPPKGE